MTDDDWLIAYLEEEARCCRNIINGIDRAGSRWQSNAGAVSVEYTQAEVADARRRLAEVEAQLSKINGEIDAPPSA